MRASLSLSSSGIVGVNGDVFLGEVAGPETARARADAEIDAQVILALGEMQVGGVLIHQRRAAAGAAYLVIAEPYVDLAGIDLYSGVADGGENAAPVGIVACPGGFDQWRVGDRSCDLERIGVAGRAFDAELDDVSHALAVGNDLFGEVGADCGERGAELSVSCVDSDATRSG